VVGALVAAGIAAVIVLLVRTQRWIDSAESRLAALPCPGCGAPVGAEAAAAIGAAREAEMRKLFEEARAKGIRLRVDPHWRFPCPACGSALKFDPATTRAPLTAV
jgi:predicted RNA-binding Zn-ribbon protein involved in translation (DUF1610 family)